MLLLWKNDVLLNDDFSFGNIVLLTYEKIASEIFSFTSLNLVTFINSLFTLSEVSFTRSIDTFQVIVKGSISTVSKWWSGCIVPYPSILITDIEIRSKINFNAISVSVCLYFPPSLLIRISWKLCQDTNDMHGKATFLTHMFFQIYTANRHCSACFIFPIGRTENRWVHKYCHVAQWVE